MKHLSPKRLKTFFLNCFSSFSDSGPSREQRDVSLSVLGYLLWLFCVRGRLLHGAQALSDREASNDNAPRYRSSYHPDIPRFVIRLHCIRQIPSQTRGEERQRKEIGGDGSEYQDRSRLHPRILGFFGCQVLLLRGHMKLQDGEFLLLEHAELEEHARWTVPMVDDLLEVFID